MSSNGKASSMPCGIKERAKKILISAFPGADFGMEHIHLHGSPTALRKNAQSPRPSDEVLQPLAGDATYRIDLRYRTGADFSGVRLEAHLVEGYVNRDLQEDLEIHKRRILNPVQETASTAHPTVASPPGTRQPAYAGTAVS